jgi:hypothetical protein
MDYQGLVELGVFIALVASGLLFPILWAIYPGMLFRLLDFLAEVL